MVLVNTSQVCVVIRTAAGNVALGPGASIRISRKVENLQDLKAYCLIDPSRAYKRTLLRKECHDTR